MLERTGTRTEWCPPLRSHSASHRLKPCFSQPAQTNWTYNQRRWRDYPKEPLGGKCIGEGNIATFVLVHGGWLGGWCWQRLTPLLREAGQNVFAPTLTGLGERAHLASPQINLSTHIQDIVNVLTYEDLHDVILVGHSSTGMVISGGAEHVAERLAHLVYLDAYVPADGQALVDIQGPVARERMAAHARAEGDGWRLPTFRGPWEPCLREHWLITNDADIQWIVPRLTPHLYPTLTEPVRLVNPVAAALPRTYIRCPQGLPNPVFDQAADAAQRQGSTWRYRELQTAHMAMVTLPRELADLLLEIA
jgi:pimeloyl-ACP methyl ester carboxylesterase